MTWKNSSSNIVHLHTQCDNMQTRIQLTIIEEDKDKLFDNQLMITGALERALEELPFPVLLDIFDNEPDQ